MPGGRPKLHEYHSSLISDLKVPKPDPDSVSPPKLVYSVDPEFPSGISDREFSGIVTVATLLDANGRPQQVHVARSLGAAFDENAVEAVEQYRFKPASLKGKPIPAKVCIEINFRR
jgi:protein TonB